MRDPRRTNELPRMMNELPKWIVTMALLAPALVVSLVAAGCSRPPSTVARDAGPDAAPLSDAAVDAGPDAEPPLRRLVQWRLYGTTPVENRFLDPTFSQVNGISWMPADYTSGRLSQVTPMVRPSPTGMPVLGMASGGTAPSTVMGGARSVYGAAEVSVWIATASGARLPQVTLMGIYPGGEASVELVPDDATDSVTLDGLHWVLWRAEIQDGPIGWATLRVVSRATSPIFLNGPVLLALDKHKAGVRRWSPPRPLRERERVALRAFWRRVRDWF